MLMMMIMLYMLMLMITLYILMIINAHDDKEVIYDESEV